MSALLYRKFFICMLSCAVLAMTSCVHVSSESITDEDTQNAAETGTQADGVKDVVFSGCDFTKYDGEILFGYNWNDAYEYVTGPQTRVTSGEEQFHLFAEKTADGEKDFIILHYEGDAQSYTLRVEYDGVYHAVFTENGKEQTLDYLYLEACEGLDHKTDYFLVNERGKVETARRLGNAYSGTLLVTDCCFLLGLD